MLTVVARMLLVFSQKPRVNYKVTELQKLNAQSRKKNRTLTCELWKSVLMNPQTLAVRSLWISRSREGTLFKACITLWLVRAPEQCILPLCAPLPGYSSFSMVWKVLCLVQKRNKGTVTPGRPCPSRLGVSVRLSRSAGEAGASIKIRLNIFKARGHMI